MSSTSETPQAVGTKSSGESFLDILSQGTQSPVQASKGATSRAQGDSDAQRSSGEDQKSAQTNASSTPNSGASQVANQAANGSANGASSQTAQAAADASTATQNAAAANDGNGAPKTGTPLAPVDLLSAQSILDAQMASQLAQSAGK